MPSFSFEKIEPRTPPGSANPDDASHRGIIIQLFDRIAEARMQRDVRAFRRTIRGSEQGEIDAAPERGRDH